MSTNAEITYAVQNDRPSITIRYSAQEEGKSKPDLCDMLSQIQEAITKFQAKPQPKLLANTDVVVQDNPTPTPSAKPFSGNNKGKSTEKVSSSKNEEIDKDASGTITKKQVGLIYVNLKKRNIPKEFFCSSHGVSRVEDLSFNRAWRTLKYEEF